MNHPQKNIAFQEDNDLKKLLRLLRRHYRLFLFCVIAALLIAFLVNRYMIPKYRISASILVKEESRSLGGDVNDYLNTNLFNVNQNFQNELWVLKSNPVIEQTVENLDLTISYYQKDGFLYYDAYKNLPFQVLLLQNHVQPVNVRFNISIQDRENFIIRAESKDAVFKNLYTGETISTDKDWSFGTPGKFGQLIESDDLAFIIKLQSSGNKTYYRNSFIYSFILNDLPTVTQRLKKELAFNAFDRNATIIEIVYESPSVNKGRDIVNEIMDVYSAQNLDRKNHVAEITIEYIERQLGEISDSLSQTEDNLQRFRSSNQLLDVTNQSSGLYDQYLDLQNQMAELVTRKRYYDYVADYLASNDDFSNMIVPASMGIQDQLLNNLMSELITAQTQRNNLIDNNQQQNPLVEQLSIQIENLRGTISENISAVQKTMEISMDEMNNRINRIENQIRMLPATERQLGGIEREYRLNDAIYNYLLEKRAEAKITQASNLPDNIIIEPANIVGTKPISPNKQINYLAALVLGLGIPFGFLTLKGIFSEKIGNQDDIERYTEVPVLGKILHSHKKSSKIMIDFPTSGIAESYRALRTNLDFHFKSIKPKVYLITSSIEGEGKSFNALNLATSYAQLGRRTVLVNFDLRKPTDFFSENGYSITGLSSFFRNQARLDEIILHSPQEKLDVIPAGPIPPNPVELLSQENTGALVNHLRDQYDCIIMDSTPLAQVTDAYILMEYADVKVIITRYNYTIKKAFSMVMKDLKRKNIDNMCILLNDNRIQDDQYGYGYGYSKKQKYK